MAKRNVKINLLGATSLAAGLILPQTAVPQDTLFCSEGAPGPIPESCIQSNAGDTVVLPRLPQGEPDTRPIRNDAGFSIALDGEPIDSDPTIEENVRWVDLALQQADVQVVFDGFDPLPRLAVETVGAPRAYAPGERVTLQSESNYPAFIDRAEFRLIDRAAPGGPRLAGVVPVDANGQATFVVPDGADIVVVHRVYDARGRFDETDALPLGQADDRGLVDGVEELANTAAVRNIPVRGGAVKVSAENMSPGAVLSALGTTARPDGTGAAVIQRILPPGDYDVDVSVANAFGNTRLSRPVEVAGSDWFYVATADLTWEFSREDGGDVTDEGRGRLQYYVDGQTASGVQITSSLDTGEEEFGDIFRRLDEPGPRSVLDRIDPEDSYPTFGDDSEIRDDTPTSGRVYLRIQKENNFFVWGDYRATIDGNTYVRNERTLYGAQAVAETAQTTSAGEARASVELYAAQPDQLVGRETFQGTGGSAYFLSRQDITPGTETVTVEVRDADTGVVVDRQVLVAGRDYEVNYLQGVIVLSSPLTGTANNNLIQTNPGGDQVVNLVTQYEFTPTSSDVDGFSTGGRAEGWVTNNLRFGVSATNDDTGTADQRSLAFDARYQFGANSFVQLDFARSEGPGYDQDLSLDGGLTINTTEAEAGSGEALRFAGQADLRDLGMNRDGVVGAYFEQREQGFSTLDYQVTETTGDETLFGAYARVAKTDTQLGYGIYADVYENGVGNDKTEIGAELDGKISQRLSFSIGAELLEQTSATTDGSRVDLGARLTYAQSERLSFFGFAQGTASNDGLDDFDRYGVGVVAGVANNWTVEAEISEGTGGIGGRLLASYQDEAGNSRYFGYELDAGRTVDAGISKDRNGGKYITGGRQNVTNNVSIFGENTYDIFDEDRTLTSAYGIQYEATDFLTYDAAIEVGRLNNEDEGNLQRTALSFGVRYEDESLRSRARAEFRWDDADDGSEFNDFDAVYLSVEAQYKINEERRLVLNYGSAHTTADDDTDLDGDLIDASIGYAYRPIMNERWNGLARYRYLSDTFGQEINDETDTRVQQRSHVFSLEANYDVSRAWTIGAKLGGRISETANEDDVFVSNDAYLGVVNARYHSVHNWDILLEARNLTLVDGETSETGALAAVYRHLGNNAKVGVGYNFTSFSDDLTDLSTDNQGAFINVIAKF